MACLKDSTIDLWIELHYHQVNNEKKTGTKREKEEEDGTYEIFDSTSSTSQDHWLVIIWILALGLGIDSSQVEFLPHQLEEFVDIPSSLRADGTSVGDTV